ncbi:MAG: META domain-containing protein [Ignavibacteria bacterium]|nr:META domain-containing protein [Ignavibacteria bacterium]
MKNLIVIAILVLVFIIGCSSQKETGIATEDLKNTRWKLLELNLQKVSGLKNDITIIFNLHNSEFRAFGGCNEIYGIYKVSDNKITLSAITMTKINCTDGEDKYEYDYVNILKSIDSYKIINKYLYLYKGDKLLAKFEATFLQ